VSAASANQPFTASLVEVLRPSVLLLVDNRHLIDAIAAVGLAAGVTCGL